MLSRLWACAAFTLISCGPSPEIIPEPANLEAIPWCGTIEAMPAQYSLTEIHHCRTLRWGICKAGIIRHQDNSETVIIDCGQR